MKKPLLFAAVLSLFALTARPALAETWSAVPDFSDSNGNPNGVWTYGWIKTCGFLNCNTATNGANGPQWSNDGGGFIWLNSTSSALNGVQPGQLSLHPTLVGDAGVVQWTAPDDFDATVEVKGSFSPGDTAQEHVGVWLNSTPQCTTGYWSAMDSGSFDFTVPVVAGDTIAFGAYGSYDHGDTPFQATISTVPEPSTFAMLLGGLGMVAVWRRWRRAG